MRILSGAVTRGISRARAKTKTMIDYIKESYNELRNHVTWTPISEAQRLTVIVAVFSIVLALAVWGVDTVFAEVLEQDSNLIKG